LPVTLSIITVSYSAARTIEETFQSVACQTYPHVEYIVVDGASSDGTVDIIRRYEAAIGQWVSEPDKGLYDAMNKGLAMATGDYVGFLNADDFLARPDALELIAGALETSGADATHGDCVIVDPEDTEKVLRYYPSRGFKPHHMRFGNMPPHASIFVRRDLLLAEKGFNTDFRIAADFDLLTRLFVKRCISYVHVPHVLTHNRSGGVSTQGLRSTMRINAEICRSLRANGIASNQLLLWSRYFKKVWQLVRRPAQGAA